MNRILTVLIVGFLLAWTVMAQGPGSPDSSKYKTKVKVAKNDPIYKLFPEAEEIYQVEYTDAFLQALAATSPLLQSQAGLQAVQSPWVDPLCLTSLSPDKDRVGFLYDGTSCREKVEIRLNSTLRWMFATVTSAPAWTWAVTNTYMDEYVKWVKPDGTVSQYEMDNAFQLTGSSGCQNAGYWDQAIPNDSSILGVYTFLWMYLHTNPTDHPGSGPAVLDYRHGAWFNPELTIVQ